MFKFSKKKKQTITAVVDGKLEPITAVNDEVFSQKMMGDGYAIEPNSSNVYSPVSGTISTVFPTEHAIGITTEKGLEILVHMGLDTVELKGEPFKNKIEEGQHVSQSTLLSEIDVKTIKRSGRAATIIVVYTNMELLKDFPKIKSRVIHHGDEVGQLQYK